MRPDSLSTRFAVLVVLGAVATLHPHGLRGQQTNEGNGNYVYVMTNQKPHNSVIQYLRAVSGALIPIREVVTGGSGSGPNGPDPLGSQDSLLLSGDGQFLLAVNAGSDDVSVLGLKNGKLSLLSRKSSGGVFPNSVALSDNLVYVLNAKGEAPNITGFRLDVSGRLHWLTTVPLPPGSMAPNDIRFAPDGSELLVTVAATNQILVFPLAPNGAAGPPVPDVSAGMQPFGVRFTHNEVALVADAAGSLSSYRPVGATMLDTISGAVPDMQMATCWISVLRDGKYAFVSNTASGNLSSYTIGPDGIATLVKAVAADPNGNPIDSALSSDGRYLYVEESAQGEVVEYRVQGASLIPIGTITADIGIQGIAAQ